MFVVVSLQRYERVSRLRNWPRTYLSALVPNGLETDTLGSGCFVAAATDEDAAAACLFIVARAAAVDAFVGMRCDALTLGAGDEAGGLPQL